MKKKGEKIMENEIKWVEELSWEEFRNSGLLWFVNRILHLFGRAICLDYEKDEKGSPTKVKRVYFARCRFRGFDEKTINRGFKNLTNFLETNITDIKKDVEN